jgi:uncharacterized RDD family membrane protein YckC
MNYAGFWLRFVAIIIDNIIIGVAKWFILTPILATFGIVSSFSFSDLQNPEDIAALVATIIGAIGISWVIGMVVDILYHSFMESSKFQGSIGKMALGIIVVDASGQKLDFTKALIRNVCKIISTFIFYIGFIIAGFTEKKQALHDIIAGTLVIKKS